MSFLIDCPNCGTRPVWEFHFAGPPRSRPAADSDSSAWAAYLYDRTNARGIQWEWWYHRAACKLWFLARRDTATNQVFESKRFDPAEAAGG